MLLLRDRRAELLVGMHVLGGHSEGMPPAFCTNLSHAQHKHNQHRPPLCEINLVKCVLHQSCVGPVRGWGAAGEAEKAKFDKGPETYNTAQFQEYRIIRVNYNFRMIPNPVNIKLINFCFEVLLREHLHHRLHNSMGCYAHHTNSNSLLRGPCSLHISIKCYTM